MLFRSVFQQGHRARRVDELPAILLPRKGRFGLIDNEKAFAPDLQPPGRRGLNWPGAQAKLPPKGLKQAAGLRVNQLYHLARIETCRDRFVKGPVAQSRALAALL